MCLLLCLKFWLRIHGIQKREIYSHLEVSSVIKAIESNLDELKDVDNLRERLDIYYKCEKQLDIIRALDRIKTAFHGCCKTNGFDPLKQLNYNVE